MQQTYTHACLQARTRTAHKKTHTHTRAWPRASATLSCQAAPAVIPCASRQNDDGEIEVQSGMDRNLDTRSERGAAQATLEGIFGREFIRWGLMGGAGGGGLWNRQVYSLGSTVTP